MADIKQIKVGSTTYNIEPVTAYLPLTGGTMTGPIYYQGTQAKYAMIKWINNTADNYGNGIRIGGGGATIIGGGESSDLPNVSGGDEVLYLMNDGAIDFYSNCQEGLNSAKHMTFDVYGTLNVPTDVVGSSSSNRLIFRHLDGQNCNGDYNLYLQYHQRNTKIYLNGTDYYIENGSYYNGTAASAGNADTVDGDHSSAFARIGAHNNLTASGNEFTFASSGYSGPIYLNWRTAGGTNGNITEYILGNGAGASLGTIIHTGNIGSQSVNYATTSHLLRTYNADNGSHGADYYLKCRHNVDGNGRFKLQIVRNDGSVTHSTSVDFATSAGSVAWGNIGGKPSTFPTTVDSSLSSSSSNPVKNSAIYSAFSGAVGFDHDKYSYGESGSWRLREYHSTGNSLDIRYGKVAINAQEKTYSVSFGANKSFDNNTYAVVCGIYRDNRNSWFWSPLVTKRSPTGFNVYVKGNTSGDNSGTLMYIAIRSN